MRDLLVRSVLFLAAGVLATPSVSVAQDESPVQGAWITSGVTFPDGTARSSPQPGLFIFTSTHYSMMYVPGDEPRADLGEEPTDAEAAAAYRRFVANSGRYEVSGTEITTRAFVAKYPNLMHAWPDYTTTYSFAVDGDQMQLTFVSGLIITLRRVEGMTMPDDE